MGAGGICGSDLYCYHHGGFGSVRLRQPMILGHEVAGTITAIGAGTTGFAVGDKVAVSPSRPCNVCEYCLRGQQNHCLDMRFYGSAMRKPHVDGAFRQSLVADAAQCHCLAGGVTLAEGAFAEPLAVVLHAIARAGSLLGARVVVTGSGPIGALCVLAARAHGAREIIATDMLEAPLERACAVGADRTINVATDAAALGALAAGKGTIGVAFEASGSPAAFTAAVAALRPRGVLVQLGIAGEVVLPHNLLVAPDVEIRGSFRFIDEFGLAVALLNGRRLDVRPLLTGSYPLTKARRAFEEATDRATAMKVQIAFA